MLLSSSTLLSWLYCYIFEDIYILVLNLYALGNKRVRDLLHVGIVIQLRVCQLPFSFMLFVKIPSCFSVIEYWHTRDWSSPYITGCNKL